MNRGLLAFLFLAVAAMPLGGCVVYEPVPAPLQQRFDRSWAAAMGAMSDQGVSIDVQDRGAGVIHGSRGGILITATLQTLADGSIEVRFNQKDTTGADPKLVYRVSESYDRRMGR